MRAPVSHASRGQLFGMDGRGMFVEQTLEPVTAAEMIPEPFEGDGPADRYLGMSPLQRLKIAMPVGAVVRVRNHYIERPDHACYGTTERTVTVHSSSSWGYFEPAHESTHLNRWPKAGDVRCGENGSFLVYGHPTAGDLFLTIWPEA
jgi:hypothetical protein